MEHLLTCAYCDQQFPWLKLRGRKPTFCDACVLEARRRSAREYERRKAAERGAKPRKRIEDGRKTTSVLQPGDYSREGKRDPDRRSAWKLLNREKINAQKAEWRKANPEQTALIKRRHNIRKYGIQPEDYDRMAEAQRGRCAICKGTEAKSRSGVWHIDHDHVTGQVRGLLCGPCNTGLGQLQDDPDVIRAALNYVVKHRQMVLPTT